MPARYVANPTFERQQNAQPDTQRALTAVASEIASRAASAMPARGFMRTKDRTRARKAAVYSGSGWHLLEFGSVNTSARAPFRKALAALGMKLEQQ